MVGTAGSGRDFVRWNEEMSRKYDSEDYHLRASFPIRWIERRRVRTVRRLLHSNGDETVIEVGCGAGVVLEHLPAGSRIGVDLSTFILGKAKHRLNHEADHLVRADAECLPFVSNGFRRVVCTEVLEHARNPAQVVREIARIAAEEAVIVITVPNEPLIEAAKRWIDRLNLSRFLLRGTRRGKEEAYNSPSTNEWHLHRLDLPSLRRLVDEHLEIRRIEAVPFAFVPFRYVVQLAPPAPRGDNTSPAEAGGSTR